LPTGRKIKDIMRNIEHITPNTFTQFAAVVIESKLSGYSHSVCGHGRQQLGPNKSEQNRPFTTEESQIDGKNLGSIGIRTSTFCRKEGLLEERSRANALLCYFCRVE